MAFWYFLLILVCGASVFAAAYVFPMLFLKTRHIIQAPTDRGIKKVVEKHGQSMVFEPALKWRQFIKQYVLAERFGKKELMCKLDKDISYICYEIVLFNNRNKVFDVLKVKDLVEKSGYTKVVELPEETSYVSIVVDEVDNATFPDSTVRKAKAGKIAKFLVACSFALLMEIMSVKVCLANIFGGVFRESFILTGESALITLLIAGILIAVNIISVVIALSVRNAKKSGWNKA